MRVNTERDTSHHCMGRRRRRHGVRFHPESILTEHGHAMLASFLKPGV
jgi:anthranilate synthase component 2